MSALACWQVSSLISSEVERAIPYGRLSLWSGAETCAKEPGGRRRDEQTASLVKVDVCPPGELRLPDQWVHTAFWACIRWQKLSFPAELENIQNPAEKWKALYITLPIPRAIRFPRFFICHFWKIKEKRLFLNLTPDFSLPIGRVPRHEAGLSIGEEMPLIL